MGHQNGTATRIETHAVRTIREGRDDDALSEPSVNDLIHEILHVLDDTETSFRVQDLHGFPANFIAQVLKHAVFNLHQRLEFLLLQSLIPEP